AVTAGLIAITQVTTKDRITRNQQEAEAAALYEIIPQSRVDQSLLDHKIALASPELLGLKAEAQAYQAIKSGEVVAVILPSIAPDGYSGDISLIVGINLDGTVAGVRVLTHRETPGLGDKVETKKSDWIYSLTGWTFKDGGWNVKKEGGRFDAFTGATITPRAVIKATERALVYFNLNKMALTQVGGKS
ncbi:MAG: electron transport complex subunit RsxG, partial [Pontibacterium sp.]